MSYYQIESIMIAFWDARSRREKVSFSLALKINPQIEF